MDESLEYTNLDTIYGYTESSLKDAIVSLNGLNGRLTTVAGACGLLLRFAADVHWDRLRLLICLLLLACVVCCVLGLAARASGALISPGCLVDEFYYKSDEECRLQIVSNWKLALEQIDAKRYWKASCLNWAFGCLVGTFGLLAVAVVNA